MKEFIRRYYINIKKNIPVCAGLAGGSSNAAATLIALNEIFDYGRPASVSLVVLVQRNGSELPIQADVVASTLTLDSTQHVKLSGPEPLELKILEVTEHKN